MSDYNKTNWINGTTKVNSTNMNKIESGVEVNSIRTSYGNTVGGTANAITLTTTGGNFSFSIGESVKGIATSNNTGAVTCQVDGGTVYTVKKLDGSSYVACEADDFENNKPFEFIGQNDGADFFLLAPKGGANIKSIQEITTVLSSTLSNVTISQVDLNKSFILPLGETNDLNTSNVYNLISKIKLTTSTNVEVRRGGSNGNETVKFLVIELSRVKSIQHISKTTALTSSTETISQVDLNKAKIYYTKAFASAIAGQVRGFQGSVEFNNDSQLLIEQPTTDNKTYEIYVVEEV